jgi:hypothetical protein
MRGMEDAAGSHLDALREMRERALAVGGVARIGQQHARGRLKARERIAALLDAGSVQELGALAAPRRIEDIALESDIPLIGLTAERRIIGARQMSGQPRNGSWTRPSGSSSAALARREPQRWRVPSRGFATPPAWPRAARSGA